MHMTKPTLPMIRQTVKKALLAALLTVAIGATGPLLSSPAAADPSSPGGPVCLQVRQMVTLGMLNAAQYGVYFAQLCGPATP